MAKQKTAFVCNDCGSDYVKWQGQCSDCGAWNTLTEIRLGPEKGSGRAGAGTPASGKRTGFAGVLQSARVLSDIDLQDLPRFSSGTVEFDRVLGGGLVPGSAILVGGYPGAGKSTLLLQTMCHLARDMEALYITGEESLQQVAMRAQRLQLPTDKLRLMSETNVEAIVAAAQELKPRVLVVDSIQVVRMRGLPDPLRQADGHCAAAGGPRDQGRLTGRAQGAGAYDRLLHPVGGQ